MPLIKSVQKPCALLVFSVALTACGGGGGGSSNFIAERPIAITAANAPEVVAEATEASVDSDLNSALGAAFRAEKGDQLSAGHVQNISQTVTTLVDKSLTQLSTRSRAVSQSTSVDCENSGEIVLTFSGDVNENTGNGSFSGSIIANNCSDEPGEVINGSFSISGSLVSEELSGALTAEFDDFSVRTSEGSGSINGTMIITQRATVDYDELSLDASDCAFSFSAEGQTVTIGEFTFVERDYFSYTTESLAFTANSSRLGGSFRFETVEDFVTDLSQEYPYPGRAVITGENNGKIRITPTGGTATDIVTIDIDEDGDGTYEVTRTDLTWADIDNL